MSFVGTRPEAVKYVEKYKPEYMATLLLPAGITSEAKNVFLAPQQHISSGFDFRDYPDKVFDVEISYETCGKVITENYTIDINFIGNILTINM